MYLVFISGSCCKAAKTLVLSGGRWLTWEPWYYQGKAGPLESGSMELSFSSTAQCPERGEGLKTEVVTSGQCFNQSRYCNDTCRQPIRNRVMRVSRSGRCWGDGAVLEREPTCPSLSYMALFISCIQRYLNVRCSLCKELAMARKAPS